jgi:integrase/recombinase XerD
MEQDSSPKADSAPLPDRSNGLKKSEAPVLASVTSVVPALFANAGERAAFSVIEFFTAQIRNPNTRAAYGVAVRDFSAWCERRGLRLEQLRSPHVGIYIEECTGRFSAPTVKQHLAAIRMLFNWLIIRQVVEINPAAAVRGPKHIVTKGKTPVAEADEARQLLDSIDATTLVGLRDRALIALLLYTFARVSAAIGMNVADYYPQGRRFWVRLHEKGGKQHDMPAHHVLEKYLDEYVTASGIGADKGSPLFRTAAGTTKRLTDQRMHRMDVLRMIQRRTREAGIATSLSCHSFRATGITVYLTRGGLLEHAQKMASHASAKTTKLYDRRDDKVTLDEVERIVL